MPIHAAWLSRALASFGLLVVVLMLMGSPGAGARGQGAGPASGGPAPDPVYQQIKAFALTGGTLDVSSFVLKRDRMVMTFNGTFFFAAPVSGRVTGAVFVGQGTVHADVPAFPVFEKDSVKRLLGADAFESDFKTAVLRMTDDTYDLIQKASPPRGIGVSAPPPSAEAQNLAAKFDTRLLRETGVNLSARLAVSLLNGETPGLFFAEFDGGKRGHFDYVIDYQTRVPSDNFGIDGGEKGLVFAYQPAIFGTEVWMAFYGEADYGKVIPYSDANNLVDVTHYDINVDLHAPSSKIGVATKIDMVARASNLRAIAFKIGEELSALHDDRLQHQMRLKAARLGNQSLAAVQEDWEGGLTVFLPAAVQAGDKVTIDLEFEGNFMFGSVETFYLNANDCWYPRQGDLDRATFDFTYHHLKRHIVASPGVRLSEETDPARADWAITKYRIEQPVALTAFAVGQFQRKKQMSSAELNGQAIPMEFFGINKNTAQIGEGFILDEMDNAVRYFANFFGKYPYPSFSAVLHPRGFGQGFATLLFLAPADSGNYAASAFIAHETAHQWWGNVVAWRSYRDQWLSEGFAEYSAMLYAGERDNKDEHDKSRVPLTHQGPGHSKLIRTSHDALLQSPRTTTGIGKGRLADMGPIILGHRLDTTQTFGAYTALTYDKGSLVLRMLHFLLTNPSSGNDTKGFFAMMSDFVDKYRDKAATTEQFFQVAGEHFAQSPIGQKYHMTDLDWFLHEWVYESSLPSYNLDYELQVQSDNTCLVVGTLHQENAPDNWTMPLPIVFTFANDQIARTTVLATGPTSKVQLKLPTKPVKVELDPASWILSDKTTAKGK
jgi:Peptidase family M1 domain